MGWAGALERSDRWHHPVIAVSVAVDDATGLGVQNQVTYWGFFSVFSLLLAFVSILGFAF